MPLLSTLRDFTSYSPLESYLYDRMALPVVKPLHDWSLTHIEAALTPLARVLDVGCGGGHVALSLSERFPDLELVGVDLSPEQIARARRRGASSPRASFVEGSALELPFDDERFDLVYSLGSLKHWPDPKRGLRECARVLAPGGRLLVIEGDRGGRHEDVQRFIALSSIPRPLRPLMLVFFRTIVAGRSLDLDDARALLDGLEGLEASVQRGEGMPAWLIDGRKVS